MVQHEATDKFKYQPPYRRGKCLGKIQRQPEKGVVRPVVVPVEAECQPAFHHFQIDRFRDQVVHHLKKPGDVQPRAPAPALFGERQADIQQTGVVYRRPVQVVERLRCGKVYTGDIVLIHAIIRRNRKQPFRQKTIVVPGGGRSFMLLRNVPRLMSVCRSSSQMICRANSCNW